MRTRIGSAVILFVVLTSSVHAGEPVVGWRHDGTGAFPNANPPTEWGPNKNVVWKTRLPRWSNASAVILADRIFVCAEPSTLICLSRADGKILWQKTNEYTDVLEGEEARKAGTEGKRGVQLRKQIKSSEGQLQKLARQLRETPDNVELKKQHETLRAQIEEFKADFAAIAKYVMPLTDGVNGYSTATPTTDGQHVYVHFCSGVVACYDLDGNRKWGIITEKPTHFAGHSSSPILIGNKLIVHVQSVLAFDTSTGKEVWKVPTTVGYWGSLVRACVGETDVVVTPNGEIIRASDGEVLAEKLCALQFCSPVVKDSVAYFIQDGGKAVQLPETVDPATRPEVLWTTTPKKDRYFASPAYADGFIYAITQGSVLSCIDAKTGEVIYARKLEFGKGTCYPSITSAGGYVYVSNDRGATVVLEPGREYKVVATNELEPFRSCPVFLGTRMYVRTLTHLYCIGQ